MYPSLPPNIDMRMILLVYATHHLNIQQQQQQQQQQQHPQATIKQLKRNTFVCSLQQQGRDCAR